MQFGIGKWVQILETGLLPGKLIQQLNGQTQRLLGQQSLAAYTGLQVDIDRIRTDNEAKMDAQRKSGLIINTGPNLTREDKDRLQIEAREKYGLNAVQLQEVEEQLEEVRKRQTAAVLMTGRLMSEDADVLSKEEKIALLQKLHSRLASFCDQMHGAVVQTVPSNIKAPQQFSDGENQEANANEPLMPQGTTKQPGILQKKRSSTIKRKATHSGGDDCSSDEESGDRKMRGGLQIPPEFIETLVAMGFSQKQAKEALEETEGDMESAANWLMSNCF